MLCEHQESLESFAQFIHEEGYPNGYGLCKATDKFIEENPGVLENFSRKRLIEYGEAWFSETTGRY